MSYSYAYNRQIACKGINFDNEPCEYDDWLFCRNPECISPVMTETTIGSCPKGCPIVDSWNNLTISYHEAKQAERRGTV